MHAVSSSKVSVTENCVSLFSVLVKTAICFTLERMGHVILVLLKLPLHNAACDAVLVSLTCPLSRWNVSYIPSARLMHMSSILAHLCLWQEIYVRAAVSNSFRLNQKEKVEIFWYSRHWRKKAKEFIWQKGCCTFLAANLYHRMLYWRQPGSSLKALDNIIYFDFTVLQKRVLIQLLRVMA